MEERACLLEIYETRQFLNRNTLQEYGFEAIAVVREHRSCWAQRQS
jgi:hypothetical protein